MDTSPANQRPIATFWTLAKLSTAVAFWLTVMELGLFVAKLIGLFKPDAISVRHLNAEHPVSTGAMLSFCAALWLLAYSVANRRVHQTRTG
jgi:sugar phosphate permease